MRLLSGAFALCLIGMSACTEFGMPLSEHPHVPPDTAVAITEMECPKLRLTGRAIDAVEDSVTPPETLAGDAAEVYFLVKDLSPTALEEARDLTRGEMREKRCAIRF